MADRDLGTGSGRPLASAIALMCVGVASLVLNDTLAKWLTAPEQQIKAFQAKGTFPSQVEALTSEELLSQTSAFFNNAPTGKIFAERAKAVGDSPFKGPKFFAINDAMQQALTRVDVDKSDDAESSWAKFLTAVKSL